MVLIEYDNSSSSMPKSGTNSQGNHYNTPGGSNSNQGDSYHCESIATFYFVAPVDSIIPTITDSFIFCYTLYADSNKNGSYYYKNDNGSTYYDNGKGSSTYTPPKESVNKPSKK